MTAARFADSATARAAMIAGNATITLVSLATGTRYTFRIRSSEKLACGYFVELLVGPDNTSDYVYAGTLFADDHGATFRTTKASRIGADSPPVRALAWAVSRLWTSPAMPANLEVWHEGRCCRCGRALTVPSSIELGLGPDCAEKAAA